jgi:hypothetical protein
MQRLMQLSSRTGNTAGSDLAPSTDRGNRVDTSNSLEYLQDRKPELQQGFNRFGGSSRAARSVMIRIVTKYWPEPLARYGSRGHSTDIWLGPINKSAPECQKNSK